MSKFRVTAELANALAHWSRMVSKERKAMEQLQIYRERHDVATDELKQARDAVDECFPKEYRDELIEEGGTVYRLDRVTFKDLQITEKEVHRYGK